MSQPPNNLPIYRLLTGADDAAFCHRVSEALALGYKLYGTPSIVREHSATVVAQALIWHSAEDMIAH